MDPIKRGPARLRRFFEFKRSETPAAQFHGMTTRSFAAQSHQPSVRGLIDASVVSFVPPVLPLTDGPATCTHALAALGPGRFQLGARVETGSDAPAAFIVGFCINNGQGRWSCLIGALNFSAESWASSRSRVGAFRLDGGSTWLRDHYAEAVSHGVTFRFHSIADLQVDARTFLLEWVRQFNGELATYRIMSLTDDRDDQSWGPQFESSSSGASAVEGDENGTLSFRASLSFE